MQASVRVLAPKRILFIVCLMALFVGIGGRSWGQTIFSYQNSTATIPSGWTLTNGVTTNAIDQSSYLLVDAGTTNPDYIVSASYNLTGYTNATINVNVATFGSGTANPLKIEVSLDGGSTYSATTYTTPTPSSATYITGGPITITQTLTSTTKFRFSNNNTVSTGRGVRIQSLNLTANAPAATPPTLTAASGATVDAPFNVTFTDDATWRGAITGITVNGTALTAGYTVSSGKITFTPSASVPATALQTSGSKTIVVSATGYSNNTVTQSLGAGVATQLYVSTQPAAPSTNGGTLATQPAIGFKDQYGNITTGTATVTAAATQTTWTIGGTLTVTPSSGTATYTNLTATSAAAVTGATITFTSPGLTSVTSGTFNIPAPAPPNDLCANAQTLTINAAATTGTTVAATFISPFTSGQDVWYKITPTQAGSVTVSTTQSNQDLDLYIFTGSCPTSTTSTASGTGTSLSTETVIFTVAANITYYIRANYYSATSGSVAGSFQIQATEIFTAPVISPAANATVDAPFTLTYTADAAYQAAITSITVGGTTLPAAAYSLGSGTITLTPSASTLLQSSGTKSIVVIATGYTNSNTISQVIGAGIATQLYVSTQPASPATNGAALGTQPVVGFKDQYGNVTTGTATVTAAAAQVTWTIGGTTSVAASSSSATFTNLTATSAAAVTGATITFSSPGLTSVTSNPFNIPAPCLAPATQASNITFSGIYSNSFTTAWTVGNGVGRIAVINTTNTFTNPANATTLPSANTVYSGSGEQVVYAGTGNSVTVSGLTASTTYYIRVYEYSNCSGTYTYQTATATGNPNSVLTAVLGNCSSLITENFDYGITPSTNLPTISGGNWTCFADCTTPLFNYSPSRGLVYPGYADGAVGGAANVVGANKTDISRTLNYTPSTTTTSTLYMSFLMNFTSATASTNTYFLTFKDNNATTAYYAKLAPQQIGTTSTYALGVTKYSSVSSYSGTYQYGRTYLVVLKYTIVPGSSNDSTKAWVFSSGFPATEPATPTYTAIDVSAQDAGNTFASIILRQEAGIDGYIDGIRVATTWQDALCQGPTTPIAYQWQPTSGSTNDFTITTNWSPVRSAPLNSDILNFTKGGTSTAINVPNQGIGQMNVSGNTSISFSSAAASAFAINDDPSITATDLTIAAGSSFIIDSDNPLEVNLVNAATASVSGNVTMKNTTGGTGRAFRFSSETATGITFNSGSIFTAQNLLGSAFGSTTPNSVSFLSGSTYIAGDGSNPFALTAPASVVVFNTGSLYKHIFSSSALAFAGRTYGNFEYAATGTPPAGLSGTNAATIDNFTISSGTVAIPNTVTQPFVIKGNINVASGAAFNYDPAASASASTITLAGTAPQTISGSGTFTLGTNSTLSANNAAGVSLAKDLTVGGTLNLLSGSFAIGSQILTLNGPAITGTPANLATTSGSSLVFGGSSTGVFIPSSVTAVNNVTINNTSTSGVTLNSNPVVSGALTLTNGPFAITGRTVTLNGAVSYTNGSLTGSSTSDLIFNNSAPKSLYFTSGANVLRNMTINTNAPVTLNNALDIIGGSSPGTVICNGTLQTNNYLTLKSDRNGTAAVGQSTPNAISGNVTVERYTDASQNAGSSRRAWHLMTSPITGQTIHQAWQENAASNVAPNQYGTLITGYNMPDATTAAKIGYDFTNSGSAASIRHYVPATDSWESLPGDPATNTGGTLIPVRNEQAYLLFVRGDRTKGAGPTVTSTATIRATGTLLQGTQTATLTAGSRTLVGNPYASAIDFATLQNDNKTIIDNKFFLWNSKLSTYGAYVLVSSDGNGGYNATPSPLTGTGTVNNSAYRFIPSGSGFFVVPLSNPSSSSITITEAHKAGVSAPPVSPFRVVNGATNLRQLLVNLNQKDNDTSVILADGFRVRFSDDYIGNEKDNSTIKADNFNENIALVNGDDSLIVEARGDVKKTDTLQVKLWGVKERDYQLQLKADNFASAPGIRAWLEDAYLQTKQELSLNGSVTTVDFAVTADSASLDINRFRIVFENSSATLPVALTKLSAQPKNSGVEVSWTVVNETNIKGYTVEKSDDGGRTFTATGMQQPAHNNPQAATTSYAGFDAAPKAGDNYYRIRIEAKDGSLTYSQVVKVTIGNAGSGIHITLYPNPVRDGKANLMLTNLTKGTYLVGVYSQSGQTVYQRKITITLGNATQSEELLPGGQLAQGSYQIRLADHTGKLLFSDQVIISR